MRKMMMVSLFLKVTTEAPKFSSRSGWGDLLVIKLPAKSPTIRWWWLRQWWSMEMSATFDRPKSLHLLMFIKLPTPGERCRPPLSTFPAPLPRLSLLLIFPGTSRLQPPYSLFPHKVSWQIFTFFGITTCVLHLYWRYLQQKKSSKKYFVRRFPGAICKLVLLRCDPVQRASRLLLLVHLASLLLANSFLLLGPVFPHRVVHRLNRVHLCSNHNAVMWVAIETFTSTLHI